MHMADALLSPAVGGAMYAVSAAALGVSIKKMQAEAQKKLPLMAVTGAFVFAAQMVNFTIPGTGSSGHIGGGMLLAALLGAPAGLLTMAVVLTIQCLVFADGGLLALGSNIFNMGVIPCLLIYPLLFKPVFGKHGGTGRLMAASVSSVVVALQLGAFAVVLETTLSGITELPFGVFALLMQPIHLAIGLVEGIVTGAVLCYVHNTRPEALDACQASGKTPADLRRTVTVFAVAALLVAGGLSLFASGLPDGLEWAVEKTAGTAELTAEGPVQEGAAAVQEATAILPDYAAPVEQEAAGGAIAGVLGALITCGAAAAVGGVIVAVKKRAKTKAFEDS